MTTLRHYNHLNTARFITTSSFRRLPLFKRPSERDVAADVMIQFFSELKVPLLAYVVMPEHVHFLFVLSENQSVGPLVGTLKFRITKQLIALWENEFYTPHYNICDSHGMRHVWMKRCYDVNCRTEQSIWNKINYRHENPVRRGLMNASEEWKWSSVHRGEL